MGVIPWHYLILTASHQRQAEAYERQLEIRRTLGLLEGVEQAIVVADPGGRRVGSGGSTICCLLEVLRRETAGTPQAARPDAWREILCGLRVLIIHAGGDSRRLPAYGPCGKVFVPMPGDSYSALGTTLFDRQLPNYLALPPTPQGSGQVVLTSGDVLLNFDSGEVDFSSGGVTGLGCYATPEQASRHGVYCLRNGGQVWRFLQKPSPAVQAREGAVSAYGQTVLDIGVFSFDAATAVSLLELCGAHAGNGEDFPQRVEGGKQEGEGQWRETDGQGAVAWSGPVAAAIESLGMDFYREVCCAFGSETTLEHYLSAVRSSASAWNDSLLERVHRTIHSIPCRAQVLKRCEFLHFGTNRQVIESGQRLLQAGDSFVSMAPSVCINTRLEGRGEIVGSHAWVEGCSLGARVTLEGDNLLVGADVNQPLRLPARTCLDVLPGRDRIGQSLVFVRCYHIDDQFYNAGPETATLSGRSLASWAASAGGEFDALWDSSIPPKARTAWNAKLFPTVRDANEFHIWIWMLQPENASAEQFRTWLAADRFSLQEMSELTDQDAFHGRRFLLHTEAIRQSLRRCFCRDSGFSADDLAQILALTPEPQIWVRDLCEEAKRREQSSPEETPEEAFAGSRVLHTLGSGVLKCSELAKSNGGTPLFGSLSPELLDWLRKHGLQPSDHADVRSWAVRAQSAAFDALRHTIVASGTRRQGPLQNSLRSDEIVWGRAPARLDLAGGWTDTPPYSLEYGGAVLNAAVLLNGQPPVQVYARVVPEPMIRVRSIDLGTHLDMHCWDDLFDYSSAVGEFSLVKGALVSSGFTPTAGSSRNRTLREILLAFGGGIEITTLAAVPKGSGLGTSSIMGAVLVAVIHRMLGQRLSGAELFHAVLRLEQELTTGGGWQDQIGGTVGGLKLITAPSGLVPEAAIRYVPADVLDPALNGGCTLLYYTGMTRLAKNILQNVVGRYLDRDREAMSVLSQLGSLATCMAEAASRKDLPQFGRLIDTAWQLNQKLDPHSTTEEIDRLLGRIGPHIHGAKLLGAGGGGFLLLVCRSSGDALEIRQQLETAPPNPRARFFEFESSAKGLEISVC